MLHMCPFANAEAARRCCVNGVCQQGCGSQEILHSTWFQRASTEPNRTNNLLQPHFSSGDPTLRPANRPPAYCHRLTSLRNVTVECIADECRALLLRRFGDHGAATWVAWGLGMCVRT